MTTVKPPARYLVQRRRARSTGTIVEVYDTTSPLNDFDPDGGRWVTFCVEHFTLCNHITRELAIAHAAYPSGWCDECEQLPVVITDPQQ